MLPAWPSLWGMCVLLFLFLFVIVVAGVGAALLLNLQSEVLRQRRVMEHMQDRLDRLERAPRPTESIAVAQPALADIMPPPEPEPETLPIVAPEPPAPRPDTLKPAVVLNAGPWESTREVVAQAPVPNPVLPPAPSPAAPPVPSLTLGERFEALVGGKLPIWIGAIALAFAAFFLVRYSIEMGLLGPAVRSSIAGVFGVALLGASEFARRWSRTADDPRIPQALAGAGIASLYGTLYMAGQLYGLIGPITAFALMAVVTVAALYLSLRNGPPTAILGLVGGFAAPFLADSGSGQIVPVLIYLGLLVAGLFALAIHRGWMWLALAATGGGLLWSTALLFSNRLGGGLSLGLFIAVVAIVASIAIPRTGKANRVIQLLPMAAGLIQLMILAPLVQFSLQGWMLYALLSAACLSLGLKQVQLLPASALALALVCVVLLLAGDEHSPLAYGAALVMAVLFGLPGHALALKEEGRPWWAGIALGATAGPLATQWFTQHDPMASMSWAGLWGGAALIAASLSWRARGQAGLARAGGAALAAVALVVAGSEALDARWLPFVALVAGVGLSAWGRETQDGLIRRMSLASALFAGLTWFAQIALHEERLISSVFGSDPMPDALPLVSMSLLPILACAATAWLQRGHRLGEIYRWAVLLGVVMIALQIVPSDWHPAAVAALVGGMLVSRMPIPLPRFGMEALAGILALTLFAPLMPWITILGQSLSLMETAHFGLLPAPLRTGITLGVPLLIAGGSLASLRRSLATPAELALGVISAALASALLYWGLKQPLHIGDEARFLSLGFIERALITQMAMAAAWLMARRGGDVRWAAIPLSIGLGRFIWFDLIGLNPVDVAQHVGTLPVLNAAVLHAAAMTAWLWLGARLAGVERFAPWLRRAAIAASLITVLALVRQWSQGSDMSGHDLPRGENYGYSAALLLLSIGWLWMGMTQRWGWLRIAGLALLTGVTLKVFLIDAAALEGLLRVFSFLGLGGALIGIGWAYGRLSKAAAISGAGSGEPTEHP
ncbi:MAG TPA: DUF2339 domain-containing protein [Chakrabartia sp.]|nr:DUF2339 domain-containing protein [Chakrabartia sp.]